MDSLTNLLNNNLDVTNPTSVQDTISKVEKYMNNLSAQAEELVHSQYRDVKTTMAETDALHQKSKQFISEFQLLNGQISQDLDVEIVSTEDTQKALMNRMLKSESLISILHQLCQCHEMVEAASDSENLLEEAKKLRLAELKLKALCSLTDAPSVVHDMRERIQDRLLEIFKLVSDWSSVVSIQNRQVKFSYDAIESLNSNIEVLEVIAESELTTIALLMANNIMEEIIGPTIIENFEITCKEAEVYLTKTSASKEKCFLEMTIFFKFMAENFLPTNEKFNSNFWESLFEDLAPRIKELIKKEVPTKISDLEKFAKEFIPGIENFEASIQQYFKQANNTQFKSYASNFHMLFAQKFKEICYNEARAILISDSKESFSVSDILTKPSDHPTITPPRDPCSPLTLQYPHINTIMRLPEFPVSGKAVKLANLFKRILLEATCKTLTPQARLCLCETARTVIELFMIPSFDPFVDTENPKKSAVFFCDSWYLSHSVFWESLVLKNDLPDENFIDIVSYLKNKGTATLRNSSNALSEKVETLFRQIGGLDGQGKENHGMVIEMAFVQIVALINKFMSAWKKNLPKDRYQQILRSTIDKTLKMILSDTLAIQDISAKHSTCLSNNFSLLLDQLSKVRSDDLEEDSDSWVRFKLVIGLMDDSLVKIVEGWENGTLSKYFRSSEIQHLVRALFQNTDKNAALRRRITGDVL